MLDRSHYELLAKYESSDEFEFDADELMLICSVLNLDISEFTATRLTEYRTLISDSIREQNEIMTELGGEFLRQTNGGENLVGMHYWVRHIGSIKSPYMLDVMLGLCRGKGE